ncbi:MAG: patatin-like phospholipase family protein [Burkholderiales bacterium]
MDLDKLMNHPDITRRLAKARSRLADQPFSDIIDDEGHQYVDLVMEGGGMLGIALVGYTWALEQIGIRFLGVGGTSAGSINALLISALDVPAAPKSPKLLKQLAEKNFFDFIDGDDDARDFIECWVQGAGKFKLAFKGAQVMDNLNERLGLNPGRTFEQWVRNILRDEGIRTLGDLEKRMNTLPKGLRTRDGKALNTPKKAGVRLAIVTADVSTETKVVFPDMARMYFKDPAAVNPAVFVRASMSIPYFFEPLTLKSLPQDEVAKKMWRDTGFDDASEGGMPRSALFVDGGIMSNFPIDVFHVPSGVPEAPTFGVKLEYDRRRHDIGGPFELFGAIFNSARHCLDYDFIHRNPDYARLVQWIPCRGYNWLDFNMSDEKKAGLFREGALSALDFLETFDWQGYKDVRKSLSEAAKS